MLAHGTIGPVERFAGSPELLYAFPGRAPVPAAPGLLIQAAALEGPAARAAWDAFDALVPWEEVTGPAARVLPTLFPKLERWQVRESARAHAKAAYVQAWLHSQRLLAGAQDALQALQAAGIELLFLKGAALVPRSYEGDWARRPMADIDLAVRPRDLPRAAQVLEEHGWAGIYTQARLKSVSRILYGCAFRNPRVGELDLHWRLARPCSADAATEALWASAVPLEVEGIHGLALGATDQLFHVLVHADQSRVYNRDISLHWAVDALLLLAKEGDAIEWGLLVQRARAQNVGRALRARLSYLRDLGAAVPGSTLEALRCLEPSWAERLEDRSLGCQQLRSRRLLNLGSQFLRLRSQERFRSPLLGPARFLQDYWAVESGWTLPVTLAAKAAKNAAALIRRR